MRLLLWDIDGTLVRIGVIGDTPRDFACAKAGGARCVLVATGGFGRDELEGLGADAVLDDLSDTDAVVSLLTRPAGPRQPSS